jgi:hypothetical protein
MDGDAIMFTIGGMKFYGNPDVGNMIWSYPSDGSEDFSVPENYYILSEQDYNAIRTIQAAENTLTPEEVLAEALAERDRCLALAALRIAPLQNALDIDDATEVEKTSLELWKKYSVAVNRVANQSAFPVKVEWPIAPGGF